MGLSKKRSFRLDAELDAKVADFAKTHYSGSITRLIVNALGQHLQEETDKVSSIPQELLNSIAFVRYLLLCGPRKETTWDLLLKEVSRQCEMAEIQ